MAKKKEIAPISERKIRPALTPEARDNQLIALSYDLVEERLKNGTATAAETTHFLRLGAAREKSRLELELMEKEKQLKDAKIDALQQEQVRVELYKEAIEAMRQYRGIVHVED